MADLSIVNQILKLLAEKPMSHYELQIALDKHKNTISTAVSWLQRQKKVIKGDYVVSQFKNIPVPVLYLKGQVPELDIKDWYIRNGIPALASERKKIREKEERAKRLKMAEQGIKYQPKPKESMPFEVKKRFAGGASFVMHEGKRYTNSAQWA